MSQTNEHKADHRHVYESFAGLGQSLIVAAQPTVAGQPCEGTLHHPPSGQEHKPSLTFHFPHDVHSPTEHTLDPLYKLSSVAPVCPYQLQATKTPPVRILRFLDTFVQRLEQHLGALSFLHRGRSHYHQHHQTKGVHNQMSLATSHVLGSIVASLFATFCRLDALAVQHGC